VPICWFERKALNELFAEARRWRLRETGGALLGWSEGDEFVVHRVLGPGPGAKHGFTYFEPDGTWQADKGARIYAESGRKIAYVGDWHTHPRGTPRPSRRDRNTANEIASDPSFRAPRPVYAIAARRLQLSPRAAGWRLVAYVRDEELRPAQVQIYDERDLAF